MELQIRYNERAGIIAERYFESLPPTSCPFTKNCRVVLHRLHSRHDLVFVKGDDPLLYISRLWLRLEVVSKPLLAPNSYVVGFFNSAAGPLPRAPVYISLDMLRFFISLRLALERDQRF